jgi:hypothetical protein
MAKRKADRPATEKLMLALEGVSATLTVMKAGQAQATPAETLRLIEQALGYNEQAQDALITVQFHLDLLR